MADIAEQTIKVKIEPEIDLSNLDDKVLDALAEKLAQMINTQRVVINPPIVINPAPIQYGPPPWYPGQIWC